MSEHHYILNNEIWRDVVGWEGFYQVSNCGRVRSLDRIISTSRQKSYTRKGRILRPGRLTSQKENSYLLVNLIRKERKGTVLVHDLVLTAFVGPRPKGHLVCHYNGIKHDNHINNLRWGTRQDNANDDIRLGIRIKMQGENRYNSKLTNEKVIEARMLYDSGKYSQTYLAKLFQISIPKMHKIVRRRVWTHI